MMRWIGFALAFAVAMSVLAVAEAQPRQRIPGPVGEPSEADMQRALELFEEGTRLADEESRWRDALARFRESYQLSGVGVALYNLALNHRSLGEVRAARDAFEQVIELHSDQLDPEMLDLANNYLDEMSSKVASLDVRELPDPSDALILRLDGMRVPDTGSRPLLLEMDPDEHTFRVELDGFEPYLWEGRLGAGQQETLNVTLAELPEAGTARSPLQHPALWISVVVAVAAGVFLAVWFLREPGLEPNSGNVIRLNP